MVTKIMAKERRYVYFFDNLIFYGIDYDLELINRLIGFDFSSILKRFNKNAFQSWKNIQKKQKKLDRLSPKL